MKEPSESIARSKKQQIEALTHKKLQLLLPSSKQILLVNSSIKYNTLSAYNEASVEKMNKANENAYHISIPSEKQNQPIPTKTSIMRIEDQFMENREVREGLGGTAAQMKEKSLKILAQTYNHLNTPNVLSVATKGKPFSSIYFPNYNDQQEKQLTSLNNIVSIPEQKTQNHTKRQKQESNSKKQLLDRIAKLQNLVYDIISGKVTISRPKSQKKIRESPSKRQSIMQIGSKIVRREKRSATWTKDPNQKTNKSCLKLDKSKMKINPIQEQKEQPQSKMQKIFVIKKKNNLKLSDNYKPIREVQLSQEKRNAIRNSIIGDQPQRPTKLKLRVNFMPNIINL